jgi:hypothetical protein
MKKMYKAMLLVLCAILLVAGSVMGTLAYLQMQTGVVENTFTVGNVAITLDEAKVDEYGAQVGTDRITAATTATGAAVGNKYKLIPGHTYKKDPTVTVKAGSENCWVFAKLEDGLGDASLITINAGWAEITTTDGSLVYAYNTALTAGASATLFDKFTFADNANPVTYAAATIKITAYAVQADGFDSAEDAWDATFGK